MSSSTTTQTFLQQTKSYVTDTFSHTLTTVKDALPNYIFDHTNNLSNFPQSNINHTHAHLNDIAKGNWKPLHHLTTISVKTHPVVGFPINFQWSFKNVKFNTHCIRCPFIEEIKQGRPKLQHIFQVNNNINKNKVPVWWKKDYKYVQKWNRKSLMNEIETFLVTRSLKSRYEEEYLNDISKGKWQKLNHIPTEKEKEKFLAEIREFSKSDLNKVNNNLKKEMIILGDLVNATKDYMGEKLGQVKGVVFGKDSEYLSFPQSKRKHEREYLDDIVRGNWKKLNHVEEVLERNLVLGEKGVKKVERKWGRKELMEEVRKGGGIDLKHVEVVEKGKDVGKVVGRDYKMKKGVDRKKLMNEIEEFEGSILSHVGSS